ncbi:hypothetical protein D3C75_343160 [compost metagenome]
MKITEIHRTGTTDDEALEAHSRTLVNLSFEVSFAHEQGLESVFAELLQHGHFTTQLEAAFTAKFKELAQRMIMSSKVPPGHGWMDDLEAEVLVNEIGSQQID